MMEWSVEDMHKELMVVKTPTKMWLETKGMLDQTVYIDHAITRQGGLHHWETILLAPQTIMPRNNQTVYGKPLKAHSDKHLASGATGNKL